jgi:Concanavalin A-like lectin/glucanases superfamily
MQYRNILSTLVIAAVAYAFTGCQKTERPSVGEFIQDTNPPGGPLKFYVAFDGTTTDPLRNAVDSMRANFATSNPLTFTTGISGRAIQGAASKDKAVKYSNPNEFADATSFSVSYWLKHVPQTDGEPEFHFSLPSKDHWHSSALFLLVEKAGSNPENSTASQMACSFAVKDKWVEFRGNNRLPNVLNGNWHHLVFTYDETTSKVTAYVDGVAVPFTGSGNIVGGPGSPLGKANFWNASRNNLSSFIVGGWNKHVGGLGDGFKGAQDSWIHSYSGAMDQFRLYSKALTASEVTALFNTRR